MPIQVKEVAFVFHGITDVGRARKFYEDLLGLKAGLQAELQPGKWWIEYDIAGQTLAITNTREGLKPAENLMLEVADLDAALQAAKDAGATIVFGIMEFRPCRMFAVKDPDGNQIGLHQRKAK